MSRNKQPTESDDRDDEQLRYETEMAMRESATVLGECDCCGADAELTQCWAFGNMETWACAKCRGVE